jgi:hypothetical protein
MKTQILFGTDKQGEGLSGDRGFGNNNHGFSR